MKDLYVLKKYSKTLGIILLLYAVWGYAMDSISFLGGVITLLFAMMVNTSLSYDDAAKWDVYALTLPISRRDMVTSKYILSLAFLVPGFLLSLLFITVITRLKGTPFTLDIWITLGVMISISAIYQCIIIPFILKFGTEKARIASASILIAPSLLIFLLFKANIPKPSQAILDLLIHNLPFLAGGFLVVIFVVSYFISIKIVENKEY